MELSKKIIEYINETIETKRTLRKQIVEMREQNNKLMATIQERDLNMKDVLKQKEMYKKQLREAKRKINEMKHEQ